MGNMNDEVMEGVMENSETETSEHSIPTKLLLLGIGAVATVAGIVYRKVTGKKNYAEVDCGRIVRDQK